MKRGKVQGLSGDSDQHSRYSLLFKRNFASHCHDCFGCQLWRSYQYRTHFGIEGLTRQFGCVLSTYLNIHVPKVTCRGDFVSFSGSQYQPPMTISRKRKNLHTSSATPMELPQPSDPRERCTALAIPPSRLLERLLSRITVPSSRNKQTGPGLAESNIWSLCAKCNMPALKSRVRLILNFDFNCVEALRLVRRYLRYFNIQEVGNLILQSIPSNITRPIT
jgi:hypothetical protein